MQQQNFGSYIIIAAAVFGILYLCAHVHRIDVGTQDRPHVVQVHR